MRKIIDRKAYDTSTAEKIAEDWNGLGSSDFRYLSEELYRTKKGNYFLFGSGGALTKYSETNGRETWGIDTIIPMSEDEAYQWLEDKGFSKEIGKYFADKIEDA